MQKMIDGFDECVNDLESASDEEETKFYTDSCQDDIEDCKKELPYLSKHKMIYSASLGVVPAVSDSGMRVWYDKLSIVNNYM